MIDKTKLLTFLLSTILFIAPSSQYVVPVIADENSDVLFENYSAQDDATDEVYFNELAEESESIESVEEVYYEDETASEEYAEAEIGETDSDNLDDNGDCIELFDEGNSEEATQDICFSDEVDEETIQENIEEYVSSDISNDLIRNIRVWKSEDGICMMMPVIDRNPFLYSLISLTSGETITDGVMSNGSNYQYGIIPIDRYEDGLIDREGAFETDSFELILSDESDRYPVRFSNDRGIEISSILEAENGVTISWQDGSDRLYSVLIQNPDDGSIVRYYDTDTMSTVITPDEFDRDLVYVTSYQYDESNGYMVFFDAVFCNPPDEVSDASEELSSDDSALAEKDYIGLDVDYHTKDEIIAYMKAHPVIVELPFFSEDPHSSYPYKAGKMTDSILQSSVTYLNNVRYIAGVPSDVELDYDLCNIAQHGALLLAACGIQDHEPPQPEDMPDDIYELGFKGTSSSNLSHDILLKDAISNWMFDSSIKNLKKFVGHRRWLINPAMKFIGFGNNSPYFSHSLAYVKDSSRKVEGYKNIAWPAQTMPVESFAGEEAWHVSVNYGFKKDDIDVTLVRRNDGKKWIINSSQKGLYFDATSDGNSGIILFVPEIYEYKPGDIFDVTITGVSSLPFKYSVEFFSICNDHHDLVESIWPPQTCVREGTRNLSCKYCEDVYSKVIDSFGHDYSKDKIENGKITLICNRCGDKQTKNLPKSISLMFTSSIIRPSKNSLPGYIYVDDVITFYPEDIASIYSNKRWALLDVKTDDPMNCLIDLTEQKIKFRKPGDYKVTFFGTYNPNVKLDFNLHVVDHLKGASITTDLKSPQMYKTKVRLQAKAIGGSGSYYYSFHATDSNGRKYDLTQDSSQYYYDFYPDSVGTWKLSVDITDEREKKTVNNRSKTIDFVVKKLDISKAKVSGLKDLAYSGSAQTQSFEILYGDISLNEGTDYEVSYKNNIDIGKATVIIKGIGNCEGTIKKYFNITKKGQKLVVTPTKVSICVGDKSTISVSGNKGKLSFVSSNPSVAKVSNKGVITALKFGKADITVKASATGQCESEKKVVKVTVVPGATSSVSATMVSNGIKITWKKVQGATGYDLYENGNKIMSNKKDLSYTDKANYYNGSKITYKVVARSSYGASAKSNSTTWYFLGAPEIRELTSRKSGRLSVWWTKNKESNGSQIQYSTDKSFNSGVKEVTVSGTDNRSHVINSLPSGKTYYVRVRRYKTVGNSKYYSR